MNHLERLQDLLPPAYSIASDSILTALLDIAAMEMEIFQEDLDRVRQSHWIESVYRLEDAEKLAALLGIKRLAWETLPTFRERLIALVPALLEGATGPNEIKQFVYDYISRCERVLSSTFMLGLRNVTLEQAYEPPADRPLFRPLRLLENPRIVRRSSGLAARGGKVPYLYRWQEINRGLSDTLARFAISGVQGRRTSVPILVNLTTGDLIGFMETLRFGDTLELSVSESADSQNPRLAAAARNGRDATASLFSASGFTFGAPLLKEQFDPKPLLPRLARGPNEWVYLSAGFYGVKGLDHFFFSIAGDDLREGVFDQTFFDEALFPSGTAAQLEMEWTETEPAAFEVHVPRCIVREPQDLDLALDVPAYEQIAEGLRDSILELHAAGVSARTVFEPFRDIQRQKVRAQVSWIIIDPEQGPAGIDRFELGGRFGSSPLGGSRFG